MLKAMVKRALNKEDEKLLIAKTLQRLDVGTLDLFFIVITQIKVYICYCF